MSIANDAEEYGMTEGGRRIGDYLVEYGFLEESQVLEAILMQGDSGRPLGEILTDLGYVSEAQLTVALAIQTRDRNRSPGLRRATYLLWELFPKSESSRALLFSAVAASFVSGLVSVPILVLSMSGWAWDVAGMGTSTESVVLIAFVFGGLLLCSIVVECFGMWSSALFEARLLRDLAVKLHGNIIARTPERCSGGVRDECSGILGSSLQNFVGNTATVITSLPRATASLAVFVLLVACHIPILAIVVLVLALLVVMVPRSVFKMGEPYQLREQELIGVTTSALASFFVSYRTSGGPILPLVQRCVVDRLNEHHSNQATKWFYWNGSYNLMKFLDLAMPASVIAIGGWAVLAGTLELSVLFSVFLASCLILPRVNELNASMASWTLAVVNARIVSDQLRCATRRRKSGAAKNQISRVEIRVSRGVLAKCRDDLCLEFLSGNLYLITGGSGAGKTTLLKLMCGLVVHDLHGLAAFVGQHPVLFEDATILENIVCGDQVAGDKLGAIQTALASVGGTLFDRRNEPLMATNSVLSGGELKKVHVLQGAFSGATIKVFDEPTANLDRLAASAIKRLLSDVPPGEIRIVVSHDAEWGIPCKNVITL